MFWEISYFDEKVEKQLYCWPQKMLAKYLRIIDLMEKEGPDLGMPLTRAMGGGLFEIRAKSVEGIGRAFFCIVIDREIVILHQFIKKTNQTPRKELEIARERMKVVKK